MIEDKINNNNNMNFIKKDNDVYDVVRYNEKCGEIYYLGAINKFVCIFEREAFEGWELVHIYEKLNDLNDK